MTFARMLDSGRKLAPFALSRFVRLGSAAYASPRSRAYMAERQLLITSFVRGDYLNGICTECKTTFRVGLADDLKAAKTKVEAEFEKHKCQAPDSQKIR